MKLAGYDALLADVARVVEDARRTAARTVNAVITTTYWFVGRRIVEQEQKGLSRASYGEQLLKQLARRRERSGGLVRPSRVEVPQCVFSEDMLQVRIAHCCSKPRVGGADAADAAPQHDDVIEQLAT